MKLTLIFMFVLVASWTMVLCTKEEPMSEDPPLLQVPAIEARSRFAALDDVRLLANGLHQLGHSLRDFVHKTKGQINDIFQKLNIFDHSFNQLSVLASEIKEEEEELKKTTVVLEANNEEIKSLSLEINSKVENILQERSQLQSMVGGLEEKLSGLSQGLVPAEQLAEISTLKDVIHTQERSISELLKAVREQSDQLVQQRSKIKNLEEKLTYNPSMQETIEKPSDNFQSFTPDLTVYLTNTSANGSFDMTDGGATIIQRRKDGSVNFDQNWEKFENGFGDFHGEFWLGLKKVHSLASQGDSFLNIQLQDWKQGKRFIEYNFSLDGPEAHYTIHLSQASGNLPDAMSNHTGMKFSTKDRDNDNLEDSHCAYTYTGGWWFNACGDTNLNGRYIHVRSKGRSECRRGIHWKPTRGASYYFRSTQISIRSTPTTTATSTSSETGNFR